MTEVILPVGASAEPETCGSCKFFRRRDGGDCYGYCQIKLPPNKEYFVVKQVTGDEYEASNFLKDNASCDFWKSNGVRYIVQRYAGTS